MSFHMDNAGGWHNGKHRPCQLNNQLLYWQGR